MKKFIFAFTLVLCLLASGCQSGSKEALESQPSNSIEGLNVTEYLAPIQAQADDIRAALEQDPLTQTELNEKAQELYTLWDDAMNQILTELRSILPEAEFSELEQEQAAWISVRDAAMEEAGKEVEGGSMQAMVTALEGASQTEARLRELIALLK